jgi:hypothetical protein
VANGDTDVSQPADAAASLVLRYARPVGVGLLLLIIIAGIDAASPAVTGLGPWRHDALGLGIGLELALASLEIALVVMQRRRSASGDPAAALRHALSRVIAVLMVAIVVIAIANFVANKHGNLVQRLVFGGRSRRRKPPALPRGLRPGTASTTNHLSYLLYGLVGLIVLAAIVASIVLVWRSRTRLRHPAGDADEVPEDAGEDLRQAVDSGRQALRAVDDARAAIISCYVAMEDTLASAGATRAIAETPDELLTRAVAAGLIRGRAAGALTGLFYEARFSSRPMPPTAKDSARQALDAISGELAGRAVLAPAAAPSAGPAPAGAAPAGAAPAGADG